MRKRTTVLAVNLGGAVVPAALSAYLIAHDHLGLAALAAVALVGGLVHLVARPVAGLGIAVPHCCQDCSRSWSPWCSTR